MKCQQCGTENDESYRYCGSCGVPLRSPVSDYVPIAQRQYPVTAQRKIISGHMQAWIAIGVLALLALCLCIIGPLIAGMQRSTSPTVQLPSFQVIGRDLTALSLLVPKDTTDEQLAQLIYAFRQARKENRLGRMGIPSTTRGGKYGDYAIVVIYVFTEP